MHVSKEFLMEAVSLSLLVSLILIGMQLFQRATKMITLLEERQEQQITELEEHEILKYDGLLIDGMTAISYIKRMVNLYDLPIDIVTSVGEFMISEESDYVELRNIESEKYINPLARYRCMVVRDSNEAITKVKIELEGD